MKINDYRIAPGKKAKLTELETESDGGFDNEDAAEDSLKDDAEAIDDLQEKLFAEGRRALLVVLQGTDTSGKDGTIRKVFSLTSPLGVSVTGFGKPSDEELDHDFLWRTTKVLPHRGRFGIFNRSYYEEVLVVKVHPEIVHSSQKLPARCTEDMDKLWKHRYESIRDYEKHLWRNGTKVLKFFLHLSGDEQRQRFLDRIDEADKNWKFNEGDVEERAYWDDYQQAYEDAINATATEHAPWFVIPADDKKNMRLIVAQIILEQLKSLDMEYPVVSAERREELQRYREKLLQD